MKTLHLFGQLDDGTTSLYRDEEAVTTRTRTLVRIGISWEDWRGNWISIDASHDSGKEREMIDQFLRCMILDDLHPALTVKSKLGSKGCLPYLDVLVHKDTNVNGIVTSLPQANVHRVLSRMWDSFVQPCAKSTLARLSVVQRAQRVFLARSSTKNLRISAAAQLT